MTDSRLSVLKASFDGAEIKAHHQIRRMLWAMYPTDANIGTDHKDDGDSDQGAALIIDGLRDFGLKITESVK